VFLWKCLFVPYRRMVKMKCSGKKRKKKSILLFFVADFGSADRVPPRSYPKSCIETQLKKAQCIHM